MRHGVWWVWERAPDPACGHCPHTPSAPTVHWSGVKSRRHMASSLATFSRDPAKSPPAPPQMAPVASAKL